MELASLVDKTKEERLRWFGHIKKRCTNVLVRRCERLVILILKEVAHKEHDLKQKYMEEGLR